MEDRIEKIEAAAEDAGISHEEMADQIAANLRSIQGTPREAPNGCVQAAIELLAGQLSVPADVESAVAIATFVVRHGGAKMLEGEVAAQFAHDLGSKADDIDLRFDDYHSSKVRGDGLTDEPETVDADEFEQIANRFDADTEVSTKDGDEVVEVAAYFDDDLAARVFFNARRGTVRRRAGMMDDTEEVPATRKSVLATFESATRDQKRSAAKNLREAADQEEPSSNLRAARQALGLSKWEMGDRLGLNITEDGGGRSRCYTYEDWEKGKRSPDWKGRKKLESLADELTGGADVE